MKGQNTHLHHLLHHTFLVKLVFVLALDDASSPPDPLMMRRHLSSIKIELIITGTPVSNDPSTLQMSLPIKVSMRLITWRRNEMECNVMTWNERYELK